MIDGIRCVGWRRGGGAGELLGVAALRVRGGHRPRSSPLVVSCGGTTYGGPRSSVEIGERGFGDDSAFPPNGKRLFPGQIFRPGARENAYVIDIPGETMRR
jgi:hypothetical protein